MRGVDAVRTRWRRLGHRTRTAVAVGTVAVLVAGAAGAGAGVQHRISEHEPQTRIDTRADRGGMVTDPGTITLTLTQALIDAAHRSGGDPAQAAYAMHRGRPYLVGRGATCGSYLMLPNGSWWTLPPLATMNAAGVAAAPGIDYKVGQCTGGDSVPVTGTLDTAARDAAVRSGGVYVASDDRDATTGCHTTLYAAGEQWAINRADRRADPGPHGTYLTRSVDGYGCAVFHKAHVTTTTTGDPLTAEAAEGHGRSVRVFPDGRTVADGKPWSLIAAEAIR